MDRMKMKMMALAMAGALGVAGSAQAAEPARGYLGSSSGIVKSGFGLCWRTGSWTEADRTPECDGPAKDAEPAKPMRVVHEPQEPEPRVQAAAIAPVLGEVHFVFDRSELSREGAQVVDALARHALESGAQVAIVKVVGHADRIGTEAYNDTLSLRRGRAVAERLVEMGFDPGSIEVGARGEREPKVGCEGVKRRSELIACLAPNRRAEIEVRFDLPR